MRLLPSSGPQHTILGISLLSLAGNLLVHTYILACLPALPNASTSSHCVFRV